MSNPQSWNHVASWYDALVGSKGQYFHEKVIFPALKQILQLRAGDHVLDLACGQGAWARELAALGIHVTGVDASPRLIESGKHYRTPGVQYIVDDARTLHAINDQTFSHITCILAIQNIDPIDSLFGRVTQLLQPSGTFTVVMLHPAFRSPRITGWGEDPSKKLQFRRIDRYASPMKIPIDAHPGSRSRQLTWTYHRPLEEYSRVAEAAGLHIKAIRELVSDKQSSGKHAKSENLARAEIPMFMLIQYQR